MDKECCKTCGQELPPEKEWKVETLARFEQRIVVKVRARTGAEAELNGLTLARDEAEELYYKIESYGIEGFEVGLDTVEPADKQRRKA